jgi:hypothetical protein
MAKYEPRIQFQQIKCQSIGIEEFLNPDDFALEACLMSLRFNFMVGLVGRYRPEKEMDSEAISKDFF